MGTKILGILFFVLAMYLFKLGLKIDDSIGRHIMNVRLIGSAVLIFLLGLAFLLTTKSLCEVFGIFC